MQRACRRGALLLLTLAALASARPVMAQSRITASGDCFDGPAVFELEREIGGLEPEVALRVAEIDGRIDIDVTSGERALGKRSIDTGGASCADIVQATALALGLALDEVAVARREALLATAPAAPVAPTPELQVVAPVLPPARDSAQVPETTPRALQAGLSAEMGLGVAFTAYTSMVATVAADVAYAPGESWSPEVSGRAGILASFPSRISIDEVDVWPAGYAARVDGCGGARAEDARLRACGSVVAGALTGDGIEDDTLVALGGRLEATWRASPRVGLYLAVDALSIVRPLWVRTQPGDLSAMGSDEVSYLSLLFTSGSNFDWL
jgi:hypothetical protein